MTARVERLEEALRGLIEWAESAHEQIWGEWGVGAYREDPDIGAARSVLLHPEEEGPND